MEQNYPVTHRPDLLERLKYMQSEDSKAIEESTEPPMSKAFKGQSRQEIQRWENFTSGNAYLLYVQNRTSPHSFRVQANGKTPVDAVKRWYRGLSKTEKCIRDCVQVIAVHDCVDTQRSKAGELLMGIQQDSYPW